MPEVTIVAPCYNEAGFIEKMIQSISEQDFGSDSIKLFIVDGGSTDGTREIIQKLSSQFDFLTLLDNPNQTVPHALNIGIKRATTEYIVRMDIHAVYPPNYISSLVEQMEKDPTLDNVGCCIDTRPANDKLISRVCSFLLSNKFVVGNSLFRVGISEPRLVDTVPFGCFRKDLFQRIGYFDEELVRNQDDEFNARIIKEGGKVMLLPEPVIIYYARNSIGHLSKMFFQYGLYKPLVNRKLGRASSIRQFFPLLLVFYCVLALVLSYFQTSSLIFIGLMLGSYVVLAIYLATMMKRQSENLDNRFAAFHIFVGMLTIHFSYGVGYLKGIISLLVNGNVSHSISISR